MSSITRAFGNAKAAGTKPLIGYIMAGDPRPQLTPKIAGALIKGGIDILELGLPFSDPIADGPTIQAASVRALEAGTTPIKVLEIARQIKRKYDIPIVIMTYYNPVFRMGIDRFCRLSKDCMVDGLIIPDLPVEEAADYQKAAKAHRLDTIFLAAPSTSNERLPRIVAASSGFVYLVSHFGVTGARATMQASTVRLIKRVLPFTLGKIPLAVGFGISKPEHVARILASGADAAIVGSIFVNIVKSSSDASIVLRQLEDTAKDLKAATKIVK